MMFHIFTEYRFDKFELYAEASTQQTNKKKKNDFFFLGGGGGWGNQAIYIHIYLYILSFVFANILGRSHCRVKANLKGISSEVKFKSAKVKKMKNDRLNLMKNILSICPLILTRAQLFKASLA